MEVEEGGRGINGHGKDTIKKNNKVPLKGMRDIDQNKERLVQMSVDFYAFPVVAGKSNN